MSIIKRATAVRGRLPNRYRTGNATEQEVRPAAQLAQPKILILEDEPSDVELAEQVLRKAGIVFQSRRVDNRDGFIAALEEFRPDIILADYHLPAFDGMAALTVAAERAPDVPFIFVSGAMGEEFAIETLHQGAADYVIKDRLGKLAPAVRRALQEANERRLRRQAEGVWRELAAILESSDDAIVGATLAGRIKTWNGGAVKMCGYRAEEVVGKTVGFLAPQGREHDLDDLLAAVAGKSIRHYETLLRHKDGREIEVSLSLSPIRDTSGAVSGISIIARDIAERETAERAFGNLTVRVRAERQESARKLARALEDTIQAIATIIEARDPYTAGHQLGVSRLASAIATEMGLDEARVAGVQRGGEIHDIGKIYIPAEILNRPGRLSDIEFALIKSHPQVGYDIIKDIDFPWPIAAMILQHHERLDGSGYPNGLKGDAILLEAKILAVADVVEAMMNHRPYRPALGLDSAIEEIGRNSGQLFDPAAVEACTRLLRSSEFRV